MQLDMRSRRELLVHWVSELGRQRGLPFHQYRGGPDNFSLGSPNDLHVSANAIDTLPFLRFTASDAKRQREVDELAAEAVRRVESGDFGKGRVVLYRVERNTLVAGFVLCDGVLVPPAWNANGKRPGYRSQRSGKL